MYWLFYLFTILSGFLIALGYIARKKLFILIGSIFIILIGFFILSYGIPLFSGWAIV